MTQLMRWFHPTTPLATEGEAREAARSGALGAFLQALHSVLSALIIAVDIDGYLALSRRAAMVLYAANGEMGRRSLAIVGPSLAYFAILTGVAIALAYLVLGWVQWRRPNVIIPLLLGLFCAYNLLATLLSVINGRAFEIQVPGWLLLLRVTVGVASLLLFYNGFRGARRLSRLHEAA